MVAKILIKRRIPEKKQNELLPYLIALRKKATAQPGYISGETLKNYHDPEDYLVISTWKSVESWQQWYDSAERKKAQDKIDRLLLSDTQYSVYLLG